MSLPGVESARRRRVFHGRIALGFIQPPPLHRRSCFHPASAPGSSARLPEPSENLYSDALNQRALAARLRLDERLRDSSALKPHAVTRQAEAASIPRPMASQPSGGRQERHPPLLHVRMMKEEMVMEKDYQQLRANDCAVCLDSFIAGQTVVSLPCHHTFHNHCILPWLRNHSHCPSCRAKVP